MSKNETLKINRRHDIQILRGVSVLAVLFFHVNKEVFSFGYLGVDVFFVISGFVISNLIYSQFNQGTFTFKEFYFRRFKRIFPALISYSVFVQILSYFTLDHKHIIETTKTLIYSIFFIANVHLSRFLPYCSKSNYIYKNYIHNFIHNSNISVFKSI